MSRSSVGNERYKLAFGVDHTPMAAFIQVWDRSLPPDDADCPVLEVDSLFGVQTNRPDSVHKHGALHCWVKAVQTGFETHKKEKGQFPHLSASAIVFLGRVLGLHSKSFEAKVYELWD